MARHVDDDDDDLLLEGPQGNTYKTGSQSISQGQSQTQESDIKTPKKERRGTVTSDGSISSPDLRKSRLKTLQASGSIIDITQSQSQSQAPTEPSDDGKGYSKNTVKALTVIRRELQPSADEPEADKYMSFNNMAQKVCCTFFPDANTY